MFSRLSLTLLPLLTAASFYASPADAAKISRSTDPECRVDITGQIQKGDAESLVALESHLIVHNGESTSYSVLCLDSPGGSVAAGLAMAQFVLEKGVSTRIRKGAKCYSICAIIFMMGNYQGGEVAGISRRMHVNSELAFHRPYLSLDEAGNYTSGDVVASYEFGISSIFELMTLANQREPWGTAQIIEPDLFRRITGTPGKELFFVSTVEHVLRWKIGVDGLSPPTGVGVAHLLFACENALANRVALTTELAGDGLVSANIFTLQPPNEHTMQLGTQPPKRIAETNSYSIASPRAGYVGVGCNVAATPSGEGISVCGIDEMTDNAVGDCRSEYGFRWFPHLALYHPSTELAALPRIKGNAPDAARLTRCTVSGRDGTKSDDEECLQETVLVQEDGRYFARHFLTWPSGARTVIEVDASHYQRVNKAYINGVEGILSEDSNGASCITSHGTGNTLCIEGKKP